MKSQDVVFSVHGTPGKELSDKLYRICNFCEKPFRTAEINVRSCTNQSKFPHCPFCLRNNHHHRSSRNILVLSFRAIIGHYYFYHYLAKREIYLENIRDHIDLHSRIGLQNPVFAYDPATYLWFVDFNRIGTAAHKAPIEEVISTLQLILQAFDLSEYKGKVEETMWKRFKDATDTFYKQRKRPKDKRMLIPTFSGIFQDDEKYWERTRNFLSNSLILH